MTIMQIVNDFGINKNTVSSIIQRWEEQGDFTRKAGSGRLRVTTAAQDNALTDYLRQNPFATARKAANETHFPACMMTISRRIRETDLRNRVAARKIHLTNLGKQTRLLFALNNIYHEPQFWENVIFTDEKVFKSTHNGPVRVYRPTNSKFDEAYSQKCNRSGRFSVNVWGWISFRGMGVCCRIVGRFNAGNYLNILENTMLPTVRELYPDNNFVFQQDNCPIHTARNVTAWFRDQNIELMPWSAHSPDLNPIENVWGYMIKKLQERNRQPETAEELWQQIEGIWNTLKQDQYLIRPFISSMPRRLQSVIDKNGGMTKY